VKKFLLSVVLSAFVFLILSPSALQAEGRIKFGNLTIVPSVTAQAVYDDNIYLGNGKSSGGLAEDDVQDWITHVKPGILFNFNFPERGSLNLGYQGDWAFYDDYSDNDWNSQQGKLDFNYNAPAGLILGVTDTYNRSEDPYGDANQYGLGQVTKRWTNDLRTRAGWELGKTFRTILYFNHYKQDYKYEKDDAQDYEDMEGGIGFGAKFLPKTWGFVRYFYGQREYTEDNVTLNLNEDTNSDFSWHRVSAGLTWDPAAKIQGELNVGYQWNAFNNDRTPTGALRDDQDTWVAETSLNYKPIESTTLSLTLARAVRVTGADKNEYFEDTSVGFNLRQEFLRKLVFSAGFTYSLNDYENATAVDIWGRPVDREDDNYIATAGLDYNIQDWISLGVAYKYNQKNSNDDSNDFTDNQVMATLKLSY
jgi:hypothetical protein